MTKKKSDQDIQKLRFQIYSRVFLSEDGQKVLHDLMDAGYLRKQTFDTEVNPNSMLIREGHRSMVLRILNILKFTPDKYKQLLDQRSLMEELYE